MTIDINNSHGTICPGCREPLDPQDRNEWDEHLQGIFCRGCINEIYYWLATHEEPEQRLIDLVEMLSGKPYWEYQLAILEQNETLDEAEERILRDARARKRRSEFRLIK